MKNNGYLNNNYHDYLLLQFCFSLYSAFGVGKYAVGAYARGQRTVYKVFRKANCL